MPGFISNLEVHWEDPGYAGLLRRLSAFSRLIQFDKRGAGLSDRVDPAHLPDLAVRIEDLNAVLDATGSGRAALLGSSEGAPMAIQFAVDHPERVRALVIYGGYAHFHTAVAGPATVARFIAEIERSWGTGASLRFFAPDRLDDPHFKAWWARLERLSVSPTAARSLTEMNAAIDVREMLGRIRVPTLVLHRRDDVRVRFEAGRELARAIPGARFIELQGRDHPIWTGDSTAVADAIEEFLTGGCLHRRPSQVLAVPHAQHLTPPARPGRPTVQAAAADRRARFHAMAADCARSYGGILMRADGEFALTRYDAAATAVQAALALRARAAALHLDVAHGLHAGEVPVSDGDSTGIAAEAALRVAAAAGPDEIAASALFADLAAGSGVIFADRGSLVLDGYARPLALFTLQPEQHLEPHSRKHLGEPSAGALDDLSGRESEVLALISEGLSNREIAAALSLSGHTVKRHVANILNKMGLPSRAAAASIYGRRIKV
ncbi:MAG: alpha/beta fold hydrolase [Pseudorhodobacter sp.]|nr:alpha/beta fold hydrolase [Pseudorhodobacter sp.]